MRAWGRKGCVGVAEVSLGLMPLLPSSFQGSLGPRESPQNTPAEPGSRRVVRWGLPLSPWWLSRPRGGAILKIQSKTADFHGGACFNSTPFQPDLGAGGVREGELKETRLS